MSLKGQHVLEAVRAICCQDDLKQRDQMMDNLLLDLRLLSSEELTDVIAMMASDERNPSAVSKAIREGAMTLAETHNVDRMVKAMESFDRTAFWLTVVLIVVTVIGVTTTLIPESKKDALWSWLVPTTLSIPHISDGTKQ